MDAISDGNLPAKPILETSSIAAILETIQLNLLQLLLLLRKSSKDRVELLGKSLVCHFVAVEIFDETFDYFHCIQKLLEIILSGW